MAAIVVVGGVEKSDNGGIENEIIILFCFYIVTPRVIDILKPRSWFFLFIHQKETLVFVFVFFASNILLII